MKNLQGTVDSTANMNSIDAYIPAESFSILLQGLRCDSGSKVWLVRLWS